MPALHQPDAATLLNHEHPAHAGRGGDVGRAVEAADPLQLDPRLALSRRGRGDRNRREQA